MVYLPPSSPNVEASGDLVAVVALEGTSGGVRQRSFRWRIGILSSIPPQGESPPTSISMTASGCDMWGKNCKLFYSGIVRLVGKTDAG